MPDLAARTGQPQTGRGHRPPPAGLSSQSVERMTKRGLDVLFSALSLVLLLPLLGLIYCLIRLKDGPPVIFRQVRIGQGGGGVSSSSNSAR